jgi:hypothetical protein
MSLKLHLLAVVIAAVPLPARPVVAQTGLGTVTDVNSMDCSLLYTPSQIYPISFRNFDTSMTNCYSATLAGCPSGVSDIGFVYGYAPPIASVQIAGTIVMFSGDGGENAAVGPFFPKYVQAYRTAGYQVVEAAWGPTPGSGIAWELANYASPSTNPSILNAACRPATFLNWVRSGNSGVGNGIWNQCQGATGCTNGGMCVHANSGGAGAVAYALTWYNAGAGGAPTNGGGYLDKVVLENGPVFSDIERGCEIDQSGHNGQSTPICTSGTGQTGCNNWASPPNYPLEYMFGDQNSVNEWSGAPSPSCANNSTYTGAAQDTLWANMSVVVGSSGTQQPSFNYPVTAMSAWLCESTVSPVMWNNSAAQGELYYAKFTAQSQAGNSISVNGVTGCLQSPEDVEEGTVNIGTPAQPFSGLQAIENDMLGAQPANPAASCNAMGLARLAQH